jgi:hypothetical protein
MKRSRCAEEQIIAVLREHGDKIMSSFDFGPASRSNVTPEACFGHLQPRPQRDPNSPPRGLAANQIARALISMMARSNELQSEAGYICARPLSQLDDSSCDARPDHTLGQNCRFRSQVLLRSRVTQSLTFSTLHLM